MRIAPLPRAHARPWSRKTTVTQGHRACLRLDMKAGAANTFNSIERVYSRAIAFSNRRCSVPIESLLPNHCYVQ